MPKQESKDKIYSKLQTFLDKYRQVMVCEIKDMPADIIHKVRKMLRELDTEVVCGKTVIDLFIIDCHD
jgi:ribosomal protein L10